MAKQQGGMVLQLIAWLTGVLVSLSVGYGMINGVLSLPSWLGGTTVAWVVGWVVVITTIVSAVLAIVNK
ncbi:MAG TPA: hypothetical protein VJZ93_00105 [Candidatus Nanoarchaeia archaeon]|nr:hypothetical protein [Candidatus Nanoarchaeia archaeon]